MVGIEATVNAMTDWPGLDVFYSTNRTAWKEQGDLIGYYKSHQNFTQVVIRNAGHELPRFQPTNAKKMITRFLQDKFST